MFPPLHICRCCSFHLEGPSFHFPSVNSYSSFLDRKSHLSGQSHQSLPLCGLLQQCPELPHHKTVIVTVQLCLCLPRGQLPHSWAQPQVPKPGLNRPHSTEAGQISPALCHSQPGTRAGALAQVKGSHYSGSQEARNPRRLARGKKGLVWGLQGKV